MMTPDAFGRPIRDLRISVTDRCNYRCTYCMPLDEYDWVGKGEILTFEEITRIARIFAGLGAEKIRLTGGEPLLRNGLPDLIRMLVKIPGIRDVSLTTNGALLSEQMAGLAAAGLRRINISLDTLDAGKFRQITQRGDIAPVLAGISAAQSACLESIKINAVVIRGFNDNEILDLVDFARAGKMTARFIEYMDVGNTNEWRLDKVVPKSEILETIRSRHTFHEVGRADGRAPAVDYAFDDGKGIFGVIGSVTEPFCGSCDRARLTPDGKLVTCLFSVAGHDLKSMLRSGAPDEHIAETIKTVWIARVDKFSEDRRRAIVSDAGYDPKRHPKIEMIRLGG